MIIPKIVKVLQSLDESLKSLHKKIDALGVSRKPAHREKHVPCRTEELRVALHDKSQAGLESAQAELQLSSAIFASTKLRRELDAGQMARLKQILDSHQTLEKLASESDKQTAKIEKALSVLKSKMSQFDKLDAQTKAVMANFVKPKSKIFRPGETT